MAMQPWVRAEFGAAKLGDRRLNRRLRRLVDQLSRRPESSINDACRTGADRAGAYRLLENKEATPERMLAPHVARTWKRAKQEPVVLVVQDTSEMNYRTHQQTSGLGPLTGPGGRGFFVHTGLALSGAGEPLGVVHQETWVRPPESVGKSAARRTRPWDQKESYKWQRTVEAVGAHVGPDQQIIVAGDRESDVYGLFASDRPAGVDLLVRSAQNRKLLEEEGLLHQVVRRGPAAGTMIVEVGRAAERKPRQAFCEVRYRAVTLAPPRHADAGVLKVPVQVWAVLIDEPNPPQGEKPLHWLLLATWPLESLEAAIQCAHWYSRRWLVERYHYTLKSGCRIEAAQLRTREGLERLQAIYAVIAWKLLALCYGARVRPEAACTQVLSRQEWQVLYAHHHQRLPAAAPIPTLSQAVLWVAKLGGYWGRKNDAPPGVKVLWRGMTRLHEMVDGFALAVTLLSPQPRCV